MNGSGPEVDPSNAAQLRAWDGGEGAYWAEHADRFDRSLAAYDAPLLAAAAVGATDRVLDVGCGTGHTTIAAARAATSGGAVGVDLSGRMLEVARRRAAEAGVLHASFVQADAQVHPFGAASFDVVVSRTGAMFFADPLAAFTNIGRALTRGGRMVLLVWQAATANEWFGQIAGALTGGRGLPAPPPGAPGPFALADPVRTREILTAAGFADVRSDAVTGEMWFGDRADDAHGFALGLLGWMLDGLDDHARGLAIDDLRRTMAAHATPRGVCFGSAAWLVQATRA